MPKLTKAERAELEAKLAADDASDDDFDIEIWEGDKGARVPYSKGGSWFERTFGGSLTDDDKPADGDDGKGKPPAAKDGDKPAGQVRAFGRRVS